MRRRLQKTGNKFYLLEIANRDIWVLDIGKKGITELSFIGDVINLAARLEHNAETDSVLVDNRTKTKLEKNHSSLYTANFDQIILEPEKAKGQTHNVISWMFKEIEIVKEWSID